ncbi:hypothetical protein RchiOBHm_Chr1g0357541 [Rosa chinensis]|uniref:Uncharacterized protein n=1 Tax=Rosa chinensis TaxID=74649 RepID=A0A2P6SHZ8_ROSCH|nr:hypothetical protein RchiOBHm_Chr1g0357541 [Rosa chinensis]
MTKFWIGEETELKKEMCLIEKLQPYLNLERLRIRGYGGKMFPGSEFYYGDDNTSSVKKPFRSLQSLKFNNMSGWKYWSCGGGEHNEGTLVFLWVENCRELECFPEGGFPSKLNSLVIRECKKLNAKSV